MLARFVRKRDPRYKAHLEQQQRPGTSTPNVNQSSVAAAQRRTEAASTYVEQDWQKIGANQNHADLEWAVAEGNEDEEEWECVVCNKSFRSEAAWNSHERSKQHMKRVEKLKFEMELEDEALGLASEEQDARSTKEDDDSPPPSVVDDVEKEDSDTKEAPEVAPQPTLPVEVEVEESSKKRKKKKTKAVQEDASEPLSKSEKKAAARARAEALQSQVCWRII
jgi:DnaJ family protein A protein 5